MAFKLSARKSGRKKKTPITSSGTSGQIYKRCMPEIIFSKKEFQIWDFESFIFWSKFHFLWDCFKAFLPVFFFFFCRQSTMVTDIFTHPYPPSPTTTTTTTKKLPMALWVQFLSNKLEFFVSCNNIKITRTSFFILRVLICTFL